MRDGVNCRCSALEVLGELIYLFNDDPNGPPQQLLEIYLDDSQSGTSAAIDRVWDIIATFNVSPLVHSDFNDFESDAW